MNNKEKIIYFSSFVIAAIVLILTLGSIDNELYQFLPLLPLIFMANSMLYLALRIKITKSIPYLIIYFGYLLRLVITPMAMVLGDFNSKLENFQVLDSMPKALLLIVYEFVVVNFVLILYYNRQKKGIIINESLKKYQPLINLKSPLLKLIVIILIVLTLLIFLKYPNLRYYFSFLIVKDIDTASINRALMEVSVPSRYRALFYLLVNILRLIIPLIALQILYKMKNRKMSYIFSILTICLACSFVTLDRAFTIYIAVALLLLLFYMYPEKKKKLIKIITFSAIMIILIIGLFSNNNINQTFFKQLSGILQAYSNGPVNVATAINLGPYHFEKIIPNLGNTITFVAYFFKNSIPLPYVFNEMFFGYFGKNNHIIPLIGQGYYYFGILIAPLLHIIILVLALKMENASLKTNDFLKKYMLILGSIIAAVTPILYNFVIFVNIITSLVLPLYIIILISNKKGEKK